MTGTAAAATGPSAAGAVEIGDALVIERSSGNAGGGAAVEIGEALVIERTDRSTAAGAPKPRRRGPATGNVAGRGPARRASAPVQGLAPLG